MFGISGWFKSNAMSLSFEVSLCTWHATSYTDYRVNRLSGNSKILNWYVQKLMKCYTHDNK